MVNKGDSSEKRKKYNDLLKELEKYAKAGLRLALEGVPSSPEAVARACSLHENRDYMRDYLLNDNGNIKCINFVRLK